MGISGKTKIYGIFGYPVKHTASPAMHNAAFTELGLDAVYVPFEVPTTDLSVATRSLRALGVSGINVTVPHKEKIIPYLDSLSKEAKLIGAVNTIVNKKGKLIGYNTDGAGFVRSLAQDAGCSVKGKKMVLFGAGGAGRAVAIQSLLKGVSQIVIVDVAEKKAKNLARYINRSVKGNKVKAISHKDSALKNIVSQADVAVNASPCGMHAKDPLPFDLSAITKKTVVYDLIYNPSETRLLKSAKKKGCITVNGMGMLLNQGCEAFEIWTGKKAPVTIMKKALKSCIYK
ncbi:MAG: shikimate dehydrogenase [Candidatus Ancaeobacter aquaticus]|nr:shikimate dehydrogenase [Candidatus Ancaeobacter aquaticus]